MIVDSREFHQILFPFSRESADELLHQVLVWTGENAPPEYVFTRQQLDAWALRAGWRRQSDDAELCALLRRAQEYVTRSTPLSVQINDALAARRSLFG